MNAISVTGLIILSFLIFFIVKRKERNNKEKEKKRWIILEHEEGESGKTNKCYIAQNKEDKKKSPCFKEKSKLNRWLKENGPT